MYRLDIEELKANRETLPQTLLLENIEHKHEKSAYNVPAWKRSTRREKRKQNTDTWRASANGIVTNSEERRGMGGVRVSIVDTGSSWANSWPVDWKRRKTHCKTKMRRERETTVIKWRILFTAPLPLVMAVSVLILLLLLLAMEKVMSCTHWCYLRSCLVGFPIGNGLRCVGCFGNGSRNGKHGHWIYRVGCDRGSGGRSVFLPLAVQQSSR